MIISIIIPVYNSEKYIRECLDSCLRQNIDEYKYEVICVDDGSTDSSLSILQGYQNIHNNIRVFHQKKEGVGKARNYGLKCAKGEYVWFVDADDFIEDNILNDIVCTISQTKCDRIKILSYCFTDELSDAEKKKKDSKLLLSNYPYKDTQITRTIIKKSFIEMHSIEFCEAMSYGEDTIFNYQTRLYCPTDVSLNLIGYYYRRHNNAATMISSNNSLKRFRYIDSCKYAIDIVTEDYNKRAYPHKTVRTMLEYWIVTMLVQYHYLGRIDDSFIWRDKTIKILPCDFKLLRLNSFCLRINKNRDINDLDKYVKRVLAKGTKKQRIKRYIKGIKGYIKHPKRIIKMITNQS